MRKMLTALAKSTYSVLHGAAARNRTATTALASHPGCVATGSEADHPPGVGGVNGRSMKESLRLTVRPQTSAIAFTSVTTLSAN